MEALTIHRLYELGFLPITIEGNTYLTRYPICLRQDGDIFIVEYSNIKIDTEEKLDMLWYLYYNEHFLTNQ
jgi:hypothetical protein